MDTELLLKTSRREMPDALKFATSIACGLGDDSVPKRSCRSPSIIKAVGATAPGAWPSTMGLRTMKSGCVRRKASRWPKLTRPPSGGAVR